MHDPPVITDDVRRPIASLIGKSEKALRKLKPGTWQHTMLGNNLKALHIASAFMDDASDRVETQKDMNEAEETLAAMIAKVEQTQDRFAPGTSQHTLQHNRLRALQAAHVLLRRVVQRTSH